MPFYRFMAQDEKYADRQQHQEEEYLEGQGHACTLAVSEHRLLMRELCTYRSGEPLLRAAAVGI